MRLNSFHLPRLTALMLAALVGSAHADGVFAINGTAASTVVGGTTQLVLSFNLAAPIWVEGATFTLDWNAAALRFDPLASSAGGLSWASLGELFDSSLTVVTGGLGSYTLNAVFATPQELTASVQTLSLAFTGLKAFDSAEPYSHDVTAMLDLGYDTGLSQLSGSAVTHILVTAVPEPTPTALLLGGLAVLGWLAKRRAA